MLTPTFYRTYQVLPTPWLHRPALAFYQAWVKGMRTRISVDGWDRLPATPALLATNSTQKNDFMALRVLTDGQGIRCVTVTKAKNYHHPLQAFVLGRLGVVPLASKGYFLLVDATQTLGRRPTEQEYRQLREHLDSDAPLQPGPLQPLLAQKRVVLGQTFDPAAQTWRQFLQGLYRQSLAETVRLARVAVDAGYHVQMYPEGTVSQRLGPGRPGAVQLALALNLPVVPIGLSGCPQSFFGQSPLVRRGQIQIRVGEPVVVPQDLVPAAFVPFDPEHERRHRAALQGFTDEVMDRIEALVDEPHRRQAGQVWQGKGTRAFL